VSLLDKSSILRVPLVSMPIGLIEISAYLREKCKDVEIQILDMSKDLLKFYKNRENLSPTTLSSFIASELDSVDFKPDIVGISILFSTAHNVSILTAEMAKRKWGNAIVVCGGNHATNCYRNLLTNSNIDFVVRGEGELSFTEFVKKLQNNEKKIDISGMINEKKLKDGRADELCPVVERLDDLPMPAFDLLDIKFYKETVGASVMFTRGCPFRCTFCASHTVHGKRIRSKSNERMAEEFRYLVDEHNFNMIDIQDDLYTLKKKEFLSLMHAFSKKYPSIRFYFANGLSIAMLDENVIDTLVEMKHKTAIVAVESGSPYVQRHIIKKNISLPRARQILKYLRKKNFITSVNFILGFPDETRDLMQETIDYIYTIDVDWVYIFNALPLPGTEIYHQLVAREIINPDNFEWDGLRLGKRIFDTPEISAEELENLTYDVNIDRNFFNNNNLKESRYDRAIDVFDRFILKRYPFHTVGRYCRGLAYLGMDEEKKAEAEFQKCIRWIEKNDESRRLYNRYSEKMAYLKPCK